MSSSVGMFSFYNKYATVVITTFAALPYQLTSTGSECRDTSPIARVYIKVTFV